MKKRVFNSVMIPLIGAMLSLVTGSNCADSSSGKPAPRSGFIAKKDDKIIKEVGDCDTRHAPFSTFKVVLALMGFDAGILISKDSPKWSFQEAYEKNFQSWYTREKGEKYGWIADHTPATFMKKSVVWYSHQITQRLGMPRFQEYISKLAYGNQDVSGARGRNGAFKNDGLLNSWLGTSLQISPREQVEFLGKLLANALAVSKDAQEKTKEIMDGEEDWNGWKLYGKTGGGSADTGWFIGWIEKDGQRIVFAQYLDKQDPGLDLTGIPAHESVGLVAKEVAKRELLKFL